MRWALLLAVTACADLTTVALGPEDGVSPLWYEAWLDLPDEAGAADEVTLAHDPIFLDAASSTLWRDELGESAIRSLRGVRLTATKVEVAADLSEPAELAVDGSILPDELSDEAVAGVIDDILAGADVRLPATLRLRRAGALPDPVHVLVVVQPTLYVTPL